MKFAPASIISAFVLGIFLFAPFICVHAQQERYSGVKSQEISEADGLPVILKHLPDSENVKGTAKFVTSAEGLKTAVGDRPILELIEFSGGTEAATAKYPAGTLLLVEYTNPQASTYADERIQQRLAESPGDPPIVYRRIGNYNAFVFDAKDLAAANLLLNQIKYEKSVQWLGEDPFLIQKIERYFPQTGRDVAISTVLWIAMWLAIVIVVGIFSGFAFFQIRERKRAGRTAFSDAGGLTRLNLDDLSEPLP